MHTLLVFGALLLTPAVAQSTCNKGQYFTGSEDDSNNCLPCPSGTYMPFGDHQKRNCIVCTKAEDFLQEWTILECGPTFDTIIGCNEGYFRIERGDRYIRNGYCEKCTDCGSLEMYEVEGCGSLQDVVCCDRPEMEAVRYENGTTMCENPSPSQN